MKYIVKTTYPCVIKAKNDFVELNENDNLECEDEDFVFVYPKSALALPFCINLNQPIDSDKVSFVKHNNQHFAILEKPQLVFSYNKESVSVGGKTCKIFIGNNRLVFEGANHITKCKCLHKTISYKISHSSKFVFVAFEKDFYAFNVLTEKLSHFSGENLSFENNVLSITKRFDDFSCREKTFSVLFEDGISIQNESYISSVNQDKKLLSFLFLEAVKSKDFACATVFLSERLQKRIKKENLSQFFGEIENFLPLNENEFLVLSKTCKNYVSFEIKDEKICDISLDEL